MERLNIDRMGLKISIGACDKRELQKNITHVSGKSTEKHHSKKQWKPENRGEPRTREQADCYLSRIRKIKPLGFPPLGPSICDRPFCLQTRGLLETLSH